MRPTRRCPGRHAPEPPRRRRETVEGRTPENSVKWLRAQVAQHQHHAGSSKYSTPLAAMPMPTRADPPTPGPCGAATRRAAHRACAAWCVAEVHRTRASGQTPLRRRVALQLRVRHAPMPADHRGARVGVQEGSSWGHVRLADRGQRAALQTPAPRRRRRGAALAHAAFAHRACASATGTGRLSSACRAGGAHRLSSPPRRRAFAPHRPRRPSSRWSRAG